MSISTPPGWDASPSQGYPRHYICRYSFIHLGGERHRFAQSRTDSKSHKRRSRKRLPGESSTRSNVDRRLCLRWSDITRAKNTYIRLNTQRPNSLLAKHHTLYNHQVDLESCWNCWHWRGLATKTDPWSLAFHTGNERYKRIHSATKISNNIKNF